MNNLDIKYMKVALNEATKALKENEVPIGAVIVLNNKIIAKAHNQKEKKNDVTAHAEILAIKKASKKLNNWRLNDCKMYVTLEPCAMCASAINQSRIKELIYALEDEKNGAINNTVKLYKFKTINKVPAIKTGILENESKQLLKIFFKKKRM